MSTAWFYSRDGVQYGPVSAGDLRRFIAEKRLAHDDFVWHTTMPAWTKANEVPELVGEPPLFSVAVWKLVLMSLATFGLYKIGATGTGKRCSRVSASRSCRSGAASSA